MPESTADAILQTIAIMVVAGVVLALAVATLLLGLVACSPSERTPQATRPSKLPADGAAGSLGSPQPLSGAGRE